MPQDLGTSSVQDCTSDLKPGLTTEATAATCSGKAHAMQVSEERPTVNLQTKLTARVAQTGW